MHKLPLGKAKPAKLEGGRQTEIVTAGDTTPAAEVLPLTKDVPRYRHGVAKGKFRVPDDIDIYNDEIAAMFGLNGNNVSGLSKA